MNVIDKAREYAHAAHDSIGHKRKYTGEPYWIHTDEVAEIVAGVTKSAAMIAAAHLHDVLEDIPALEGQIYSTEHLRATFGSEIYILAYHLRDVFTSESYPYLNRAKRKELERLRLANTPGQVQTIKFADFISNTKSIVEHDPDFAVTYLAEKRSALALMHRGHAGLRERALAQL